VIAPSLIPVKPGERIKTDRRDARKLLSLFEAGLLTEVHAPTQEEEAIRDLCRCREDLKEDLQRARNRLVKMLLRRGAIYSGTAWTKTFRAWLKEQRFEGASDQVVFDDYFLAIEQLEQRLATLDEQLERAAAEPAYSKQVAWLRCFRGIDTVTALTVLAELHGVDRFDSPRQLGAYLGLVPTEHSSGDSKRRGSITKAGNAHVRRVVIEAAWHYRHRPAVGRTLKRRREGQPARAIAIADAAQQRLYRRFKRLDERGKPRTKTVVALARELVGFIWAAVNEASPGPK
jgi:transposase